MSRRYSVRVFSVEGVWKRFALPVNAPRSAQRIQQHTAQEALAEAGIDVHAEDLAQHFRVLDHDSKGLTFETFQRLIWRTQDLHGHLSLEELHIMMQKFDEGGKGHITTEEFRRIWDGKLTPSEVDELMVAADRNLDGVIDFGEFCQLMCPSLYMEELSPLRTRSAPLRSAPHRGASERQQPPGAPRGVGPRGAKAGSEGRTLPRSGSSRTYSPPSRPLAQRRASFPSSSTPKQSTQRRASLPASSTPKQSTLMRVSSPTSSASGQANRRRTSSLSTRGASRRRTSSPSTGGATQRRTSSPSTGGRSSTRQTPRGGAQRQAATCSQPPSPLALLGESFEATERVAREATQQRQEAAKEAADYAAVAKAAVAHMWRHKTVEGEQSAAGAEDERQRAERAMEGHSRVVAEALRQVAERQRSLTGVIQPVVINEGSLGVHTEMQRVYQFNSAVANQNNVLPPGLASFREGVNWRFEGSPPGAERLQAKWGREEELRGPLRDAYGNGFFGKDVDAACSDAVRQIHALGLWRRLDGNALTRVGELSTKVVRGDTPHVGIRGYGHFAVAPEVWISSAPELAAKEHHGCEAEMIGDSLMLAFADVQNAVKSDTKPQTQGVAPVHTESFLNGRSVLEMLGIQQVAADVYSANPALYTVRWASCVGNVPEGDQAPWPRSVTTFRDAQTQALASGNHCFATSTDEGAPFTLCGRGEEGAMRALHSAQSTQDGRLWFALVLRPEDAEVLDAFDGKAVSTSSERAAAAAAAGQSIRSSFKGTGKLSAEVMGQEGPYGHHMVGHLSECEALRVAQHLNAPDPPVCEVKVHAPVQVPNLVRTPDSPVSEAKAPAAGHVPNLATPAPSARRRTSTPSIPRRIGQGEPRTLKTGGARALQASDTPPDTPALNSSWSSLRDQSLGSVSWRSSYGTRMPPRPKLDRRCVFFV
eukprot:Hpha_TRINITY_DN9097_c0_g2::TRINITY_DN9097_c0_g2_i1::g.142015::m.142015